MYYIDSHSLSGQFVCPLQQFVAWLEWTLRFAIPRGKSGNAVFLCIFLIATSCVRPKHQKTVDTATDTIIFQHEAAKNDSIIYYSIKGNKITADLNNPQRTSVFDYFSHIELIPLETNDDVLIGYLSRVLYYQNCFYTVDEQQSIVQVFDEKGKFISKIKKHGQGPGEYYCLTDMVINPHNGNFDLICVMSSLYSYDSSWNHIRTTWVFNSDTIRNIYSVAPLTENVYVFFTNYSEQMITYYDMNEKKILHRDYEEDIDIAYFFASFFVFYEYNGEWFYYRPYDNDTYLVGSTSLIKSYTWDFGKLNYDVKKSPIPEKDSNMDMNQLRDIGNSFPYRFSLQGQNNRYVMAQIRLKNDVYANLIYDKSTDECKFINPFFELVDFRPIIVTNEFVLSYCTHGEIEKYVNEEILDETNQKIFRNLLNTREEMNPIIIKYHFK